MNKLSAFCFAKPLHECVINHRDSLLRRSLWALWMCRNFRGPIKSGWIISIIFHFPSWINASLVVTAIGEKVRTIKSCRSFSAPVSKINIFVTSLVWLASRILRTYFTAVTKHPLTENASVHLFIICSTTEFAIKFMHAYLLANRAELYRAIKDSSSVFYDRANKDYIRRDGR